jgi:hypothetical protein
MSSAPATSVEKTGGSVSTPAVLERRALHKWLMVIAVMLDTAIRSCSVQKLMVKEADNAG